MKIMIVMLLLVQTICSVAQKKPWTYRLTSPDKKIVVTFTEKSFTENGATVMKPVYSVTLNGKEVARLDCDQFDRPGVCPDGEPHKYQLDGKPRAVKDFARAGYLGFQDHGHKVWYRNVKLLQLK